MQKKVLVREKGTQFIDGDSDVTELITTGTRYEKNGKTYILYDEIAEDGHTVAKYTLKVSDDEVKLIEKGENNMNVTFHPGESSETYYITPYGGIRMLFCTDDVQVLEEEGEMNIIIKYHIVTDGKKMAKYLMEIKIEEIGE